MKGLVTQAELYSNPCKICQQFKNINTLYVRLPPNKISEVKMWYMVHVDLIVPYSKSIRKQQLGGAIIRNIVSLTCMTMINPISSWFGIFEVTAYDLDEVMGGND